MASPMRLALLVAAACALALLCAPAASAQQACEAANATPAQAGNGELVRATVCVLNEQRASHGLGPLAMNRRLSKAARQHAADMARRNYFSHDTPGGGSFVDRIRRAGYLKGARRWTVGENLAWGSHSRSAPRLIAEMWMNSPGHRANILSPAFREIGVGVVADAPVPGGGNPAATYATTFGARR
jgi:uncharacterized protein YkwD